MVGPLATLSAMSVHRYAATESTIIDAEPQPRYWRGAMTKDFRNIAIIAHVDHGKTTLVDAMLRQCNAFSAHAALVDRVMDSMDLEKERGITITSKNTAITYRDTKINILDTPGHADFGGEVERVLSMVEGAMLLVDASEGPLPQTRFVLRKAMQNNLSIVVIINKIDRPDARIPEVLDEVYDLFIDLGAGDEALDFPVLYTCARDGLAGLSPDAEMTNLQPLFDTIVDHIPPPAVEEHGGARLVVTNLDRDNYVGRLALGRLRGGTLKRNEFVTWFGEDVTKKVRAQLLYSWDGLKRTEVEEAFPGDIVAVAGIEGITVGDTLAGGDEPTALPRITVDEPTIGMLMTINNSPLSGQEGKFLTARQIRERLDRELLSNVSIRVDKIGNESFMVWGRGELQLSILVEQMRREGFELTLSRPEVAKKEVDGKKLEPYERVHLDVPDFSVGAMTQNLAGRKASMVDMIADGSGRTRMEYRSPSRTLIGFRGEMLTETRGEGIMNTLFDGWDADVGFVMNRKCGSLISDRPGKTTTYSLFGLQPRGKLFHGASTEVYEGMVIGQHTRENDLNVNAVRGKQLTNFRSSGADEKTVLTPPIRHTLESAIEWIDDDEYVEVTPTSIRIRKKILKGNERSIRRKES
jgi:GTP-binding protein